MILRDNDARNQWMWSPLFLPHEFSDRISGDLVVDTDFMDKLVLLRNDYRKPMILTSGYRTPSHNQAVSNTGPSGPHTTGGACDIKVFGREAWELLALALVHKFSGIGLKQHGPQESRYIHLDNLKSPDFPRPTIWTYPQ